MTSSAQGSFQLVANDLLSIKETELKIKCYFCCYFFNVLINLRHKSTIFFCLTKSKQTHN